MISNLDLNQDGYVDYLRVVETVEGNTHVFVIEAVLGPLPDSSLQSMAFSLVLESLSCMLQISYNEILQRISRMHQQLYALSPLLPQRKPHTLRAFVR